MMTISKEYYISLKDLLENDAWPYEQGITFANFIVTALGLDNISAFKSVGWSASDTDIEKLWQICFNRFYFNYMFKIVKLGEEAPTNEEIGNRIIRWVYNFANAITMSYDYYHTLLSLYTDAQTHLMDDIKALSSNKVKFNDTPQNPNTLGVYEGDDYITHFTKTEGETSSPLMSKMLRLKEIQDNYRNVLADWSEFLHRCWLESEEE